MKKITNFCLNCEETTLFIRGRCSNCNMIYDDVVPASYRNYKYDFGLKGERWKTR